MIRLYTDGASRGNPGPAAAGYWAEDADGRLLLEGSQRLPDCTNNVAEYQAVILGLEALLREGLAGQPLCLAGDSQLILRQLSGRYQVRAEDLRPFRERARALLKQFPRVEYRELPRAENARADALANAAFEAGGAGSSPQDGHNDITTLRQHVRRLLKSAETGDRAAAMAALDGLTGELANLDWRDDG